MLRDLLQTRRSVRSYKNRKVDDEILYRIMETTLLSPSSKNIRPWTFILVDHRETLEELSRCKEHGSGFLAGAAFGVVVAANVKEAAAWIEDASIAAHSIQMAIEEEGLGSCWIQIRERYAPDGRSASDFIKEKLDIPAEYEVGSIIAGGYPAEKPDPYSLDELQWGKVFRNSFGKPYKKSR